MANGRARPRLDSSTSIEHPRARRNVTIFRVNGRVVAFGGSEGQAAVGIGTPSCRATTRRVSSNSRTSSRPGRYSRTSAMRSAQVRRAICMRISQPVSARSARALSQPLTPEAVPFQLERWIVQSFEYELQSTSFGNAARELGDVCVDPGEIGVRARSARSPDNATTSVGQTAASRASRGSTSCRIRSLETSSSRPRAASVCGCSLIRPCCWRVRRNERASSRPSRRATLSGIAATSSLHPLANVAASAISARMVEASARRARRRRLAAVDRRGRVRPSAR